MNSRYMTFGSVAVLVLLSSAIAQQFAQPDSSDLKSQKLDNANQARSEPADDASSNSAADAEVKRLPDRVVASVVLVRSDWSGHDDADDIKKQLERLLKDVAMPASYRENLLQYAPRVLFSDEFVSLYRTDEFTSLMAWLLERDLLRVTEELTKPDLSKEHEYELSNASNTDKQLRVSQMFVPEKSFPIAQLVGAQRPEPPPFVTYEYGWRWAFTSRLKSEESEETPDFEANNAPVLEVDMARIPQRIETLRVGYNKSVEITNLSSTDRLSFDFPADQVAVAHGLFSMSNRYRQAVRNDGWEPVIYLVREDIPADSNGKPALAKPTVLFQPKSGSSNRFIPRRSRGGSGMPAAGGFGSPRGGSMAGAYSSAMTKSDPQQIKVFALQFVKADEATKILKELFPQENIVANINVNSVIARGENEHLAQVEAVLERLDREPTNAVKPIGGRRSESGAASKGIAEALLQTLRDKYSSKEKETLSLADAIVGDSDSQSTKKLRGQLTVVVTEVFGLRQELQRAELGLLQERIRHIESQIEQRETLRREIIRHRVDQLIGDASSGESAKQQKLRQSNRAKPSKFVMKFSRAPWSEVLSWLAEINGVPLQLEEEPWGYFSFASSEQLTMEKVLEVVGEALPQEFELVLNEGQLIARRKRSVSLSPRAADLGVATLRGPSEFRRDMERLKKSISEYEGWRQALKEQNRPDTLFTQYDDALAKAKASLNILRAEYDTQVKLLELEVTGAKAELDSAAESAKLASAVFASGALPAEEMRAASLKLEQAKVRLAQAQALLDLYRRVDVQHTELPSKASGDGKSSKKPPRKSSSSGDVQIEALPDEGIVILRGTAEGVESVERTLKQIEDNRNESAEKPEPATLKALPE